MAVLALVAAGCTDGDRPPDGPGQGPGQPSGPLETLSMPLWQHSMKDDNNYVIHGPRDHVDIANSLWKNQCRLEMYVAGAAKGPVDEIGLDMDGVSVKLGERFADFSSNWSKVQKWKENARPFLGGDLFYTRNVMNTEASDPVGVTQAHGTNTAAVEPTLTWVRVAAHEVGHMLGLTHKDLEVNAQNLMYPGAAGPTLAQTQCDRARALGESRNYF